MSAERMRMAYGSRFPANRTAVHRRACWKLQKNFDPLTDGAVFTHSGTRKMSKRTGFAGNMEIATTFMRSLRRKRSQTSGAASEKKDQFLDAKGLFGKQKHG